MISRVPQVSYKIQLKYNSLIERHLQVLKQESCDAKSYKKCPA